MLVSIYHIIGLSSEFGESNQPLENMLSVIETYLNDNKVNIIGGCCSTTLKYIKAIAEKAIRCKPRKV